MTPCRQVGEINSLLDTAIQGEGGAGGVKVVDLRGAAEQAESPALEVQKFRAEGKEEGRSGEEGKSGEWEAVHRPHRQQDPELAGLVRERGEVWKALHEAKKIVKR